MEKSKSLNILKKKYEKLIKKYKKFKLPKFDQLNKDFGIEILAEHETDMLMTLIRHRIHERIDTFFRVMERLIVPRDSIMFMHASKQLSEDDRKTILDLVEQMSRIEFESLALETINDEQQDIQYITKVYNEWQDMKKKINSLMKKINSKLRKEKENFNYFG